MKLITDESILRKECKEVKPYEFMEIIKNANKMTELMFQNKGCGIAAPQIGINKKFFIALLKNSKGEWLPRLFINPIVTPIGEEMIENTEGCLSIPKCSGVVQRYSDIKIEYYDLSKHRIVEEIHEDLNAVILQHEDDHVNGILFTDKATNIVKEEN